MLWLKDRSPDRAAAWFGDLLTAIYSLEMHPERCPLAPEDDVFVPEIRHVLYGKRGGVYRVLFMIAGEEVRVLHARYSARQILVP